MKSTCFLGVTDAIGCFGGAGAGGAVTGGVAAGDDCSTFGVDSLFAGVVSLASTTVVDVSVSLVDDGC